VSLSDGGKRRTGFGCAELFARGLRFGSVLVSRKFSTEALDLSGSLPQAGRRWEYWSGPGVPSMAALMVHLRNQSFCKSSADGAI